MSKVQILVHIKNNDQESNQELNAILQDNIIKYKEDDNTTSVFNYENLSLARETSELRITYFFNDKQKTKGSIFIKEMNRNIEVEIITKSIVIEENNIKVEFVIEQNEFLYEIEVLR